VTSIEAISRLDQDGFVALLGGVAERSPWVAEQAWRRRPFADAEALGAALRAEIGRAPLERQLALIRAHPDLAGKAALAGELSDESTREQAGAGLDRLTPGQLAAFHRLNDAYRERFGFPFVICVRGLDAAAILDAMERRLGHDGDTERTTALAEIGKIVQLRVDDIVG
jgi:2-oxo-4-hydroxy-4-carboxy-5-ureidoimidazoline decarboxylase